MNAPSLHLLSLSALAALITPALAEVIASTTFDDRTADANTATALNWTTNGVEDPGEMSAFQFEGGPINLFDNTPDVQDSFVPGINTGNGNTSWTTEVTLTALPGATVTVEDITFDYLAVSGGQVINVSRRSDFTVTLLDPAGNPVATASIAEVPSGFNVDPVIAPVSMPLDNPVTLASPGSYTLVLRGGDFLDQDETGNHTGIDNLSINGSLTGGGGLAITTISLDPESNILSLTWASASDQTYTIQYSPDLVDWTGQLETAYPADAGESTSFTFDLDELALASPSPLFFRVKVE